jgi:phytanoyl-CoA hydroxylase
LTDLTNKMTRHPWNDEFTWQSAPRSSRLLSDEQADHFDQSGYVVLKGVLDVGVVEQVRLATDELEQQRERELATAGGRSGISQKGSITFTAHLATRSDTLRRFAGHPVFAAVCADLVGPDVNLYWDQAVYKKPERSRRFPWHQDNGYTFVVPQQYLTCWVPLVPATVDNGCPQVVPGLHRQGTLRHHYVDPLGWECFPEPPTASIPAPVDPGDVLVFSSLTPHLTGPNTTSGVRKAYILQYCPVGTRVLAGDPEVGAPTGEVPCDSPELNPAIVRDGAPAMAAQG